MKNKHINGKGLNHKESGKSINTKAIILKSLLKYQDRYLPGAYFCKKIDISRAAVWKQICALRKEGYRIDARPNRGYRLLERPDKLQQFLITGKNIYYYETVDSTNLTARHLAEEGAPGGCTVVAEQQLAGRGRLGRSWFSPPQSGLWFSMVLRPDKAPPTDASAITLVTAAVLARLFHEKYELQLEVKWPNDLLIGGKKTGGILTEIKAEPDRIEYLIVGTGININQKQSDFPKELKGQATSLFAEKNTRFDRTNLFLEAHHNLTTAYRKFFYEGFAPFRELWKKYNQTLGKFVTVSWSGHSLQGTALDIGETGALIIETHQGEKQIINYGEIS